MYIGMSRPVAFCQILILIASMLAAQQTSSVVHWLTEVQGLEIRLRTNADADLTADELRSLHREIAQWNARRQGEL
jgi:hypothetical protein